MADHAATEPGALVDGGDRACGELLLVLARRMCSMRPGTRLRLVATDPAAAVDLPAWCHLTGHRYLGSGHLPDGRSHYDIGVCDAPRATRPRDPWRLATHPTTDSRTDTRP